MMANSDGVEVVPVVVWVNDNQPFALHQIKPSTPIALWRRLEYLAVGEIDDLRGQGLAALAVQEVFEAIFHRQARETSPAAVDLIAELLFQRQSGVLQ